MASPAVAGVGERAALLAEPPDSRLWLPKAFTFSAYWPSTRQSNPPPTFLSPEEREVGGRQNHTASNRSGRGGEGKSTPHNPRGKKPAWLPDAACLGFLWVLVLAFFWPLITPDIATRQYIAPGDFTHQAYPFHAFAASEWAEGRIPLWAPQIYAGHPFQADPQTAIFYPLGLLFSLIAGRQGLSFLVLEWQMIANFLLAASFSYLLVRELTGSRLAGTIGACAFTLGGFLTSYPGQQLPILETAVWLPLVLFCLERAAKTHQSLWHAGAGMALGTAALGGHPQTFMLAAYTSAAYYIYRSWELRRGWRTTAGYALIIAAFTAGIAAVQAIPTFELLSISNRQPLLSHEAGHGYDFGALLNTILPLWRTERAPYVGVMALLLGISALRSWRKTAFWWALAILALLISLGDRTPFFYLLYTAVPGFSLFKDQERSMYLFSLAAAVLAGFGWQQWASGWRLAGRWAIGLAGLALAGGGALVALEATGHRSPDIRALLMAYRLFLPVWLVGVALLWGQAKKWQYPAMGAIILLLAGDLFLVNQHNNLSTTPPATPPATLAAVQALPAEDMPYRVRPGDQTVFAPNDALLLNLQTIAGDSPMLSRWVLKLLLSQQEWRLWQLFGVKYILTKAELGPGTALVRRDGDLNTYRMEYPLPRAWAVRDFQAIPDDELALAAVLDRGFNPGKTVVLDRAPAVTLAGNEPPADQHVSFVSYRPQRVEIEATITEDALLVISDAWHPGWQATIDSQPVPVWRANLAFRAIAMPAGTHRLVMSYQPMAFYLGGAITLATLGAFAVLLSWLWYRSRVNSGDGQ